jgi:glycosyltransferase involved in cell wall biosynthesis
MRIGYFTNTYPRATDTFIRREVMGLRKRGFQVSTYSVRRTGADHDVDQEVISEKKSTRYIFPLNPLSAAANHLRLLLRRPGRYLGTLALAFRTSRPGLRGHFLQLVYFAESVELARMALLDGLDHLHNHLGDNSGNVTLLASKLSDIPYSISIHGPHIFFDAPHWALGEKTQHARFVTCIGHYCTSQMMLYAAKEHWHKFKIVRCGIDPAQLEYRDPGTQCTRMAYVGRLSAEKGLPILLQSLATLKSRGRRVELVLMGDGEDRGYLESLVGNLGLEDAVQFLGFVDQQTIAETLRASDIFVLPSFAEGIPVALMEAMAIGLPVIATAVGGVSELVVNLETGLVVHASDVEGLADAILCYADNADLRLEIARKARDKVVSEFNIEDQVDTLARLFADGSR